MSTSKTYSNNIVPFFAPKGVFFWAEEEKNMLERAVDNIPLMERIDQAIEYYCYFKAFDQDNLLSLLKELDQAIENLLLRQFDDEGEENPWWNAAYQELMSRWKNIHYLLDQLK